jgi:hypothetical protein
MGSFGVAAPSKLELLERERERERKMERLREILGGNTARFSGRQHLAWAGLAMVLKGFFF